MKRFLLVFVPVILFVPLLTHAASCSNTSLGGGVTCKATASASNITGTGVPSLSTTNGLNVTTGDTLVAALRYESGCLSYPQSYFITDTAGNAFQPVTSTVGGSGGWCIATFYAPGVIGNSSDTVTAYFSTNQAYAGIIVHDLSGIAVQTATSTLDRTAVGTATSATSTKTATFTTVTSTEYAFAAGSVNNTRVSSFAAGSGYTLVATDTGGMLATEQQLFTTIQTNTSASMSDGANNPWGIVAQTLVAGPSRTGSGIPAGHGVIIWGASGDTSAQCGSPSCIMKVTDSAGNTYATVQTYNDSSANVDEFLAFGVTTHAIPGDGSGWVKCSFYKNDGATPIVGRYTYCRVFDDSNALSADSSNETNSGVNAGALTVTGGNTDLAFAIFDLGTTGLTATPGSGYTSILTALDNGGGTQYAEYKEVSANTTPSASYAPSNPGGWGQDAAIKESGSGGTISYVNGLVAMGVNQATITVQVPITYGSGTVQNPPLTISGASVSSTLATATVAWTTNNAASSLVNYGLTASYGFVASSTALVTSHTLALTGLTASTTYHYDIVSVDGQGNTATTTDATFVTGSLPTVSSFFASPAVIASGATSMLFWNVTNASSIAIAPGSFSTSTLAGSTIVNPVSTIAYTLTATNANGTSTAMTSVEVATAPPAPSSLTVTGTTTSTASLAWASSTPNNGATISFYAIYRGATTSTMSQVATTSQTNFTDSGLLPATTYFYSVTAQDSVGNVSASSLIVSGATQLPSGGGNIFYIAANGNDANNGLTTSTPWADLPGMVTCTGNCASYAPQPGDQFIFRGGDTWSAASLGIVWQWSGTAAAPIYIGVNPAWYSGSSWTMPVWTCGGTACAGTGVAANFFTTTSNFITLDSIELTGLSSTGGQPNYFAVTGQNDILKNIEF